MAWRHYLSQCWPRSIQPYHVTRPQWVNIIIFKWLYIITERFKYVVRFIFLCMYWYYWVHIFIIPEYQPWSLEIQHLPYLQCVHHGDTIVLLQPSHELILSDIVACKTRLLKVSQELTSTLVPLIIQPTGQRNWVKEIRSQRLSHIPAKEREELEKNVKSHLSQTMNIHVTLPDYIL